MPKIKDSEPRCPLRAWRKAYGLTQAAVARKLGIDPSQVSRQESCGRIGMTYLALYAKAYGVGLDDLLSGPQQLES